MTAIQLDCNTTLRVVSNGTSHTGNDTITVCSRRTDSIGEDCACFVASRSVVNVSPQTAEVSRAFVQYIPNYMEARVGRKY